MSLPKERGQGTFFDVSQFLEPLFSANDPYRLFQGKVVPALERARGSLEGLYCVSNGRPAIDPVLMAAVTLLQFMEKVPDRKAVESVKLHLGWKFALNLPVDYAGFHATSLAVFRDRLVEGEKPRAVFDAVLKELRELGLVKKRGKQRLDSTHVVGNVSKMSDLEVVRETIRLMLEELQKKGAHGSVQDWEELNQRYCESELDWRQQNKEKLLRKLEQAGKDMQKLVAWLEQQEEEQWRRNQKGELLKRVFEEQFEVREKEVQRRGKIPTTAVCNPHDPDAQRSSKDAKGKKSWQGYKAQVMETVAEEQKPKPKGEPTEQFITEVTTTEAIASDYEGKERAQEAQQEHGLEHPTELYVDAGYVSGDTLAEAKQKDYELMGPARPSPNKKVFPVEEFDVNIEERKAICPAGKTSTQCSLINDSHKGDAYYRFEWGAQCDECPLKGKCTSSKKGRRILCVGIHHDLLQQRRREMKTDEFKKRMHQRNAIEGTISELKRAGLRRSRYRGLEKTSLANYFIGAACNVKRWFRRMVWELQQAQAST